MTVVRLAAHVHSSWSYDGAWSLEDIAREFRRRRYHVVLMSEHDRGFDAVRWAEYQRACESASTDDLLLVPGIEYEDDENIVHTPVWGDGVPFLGAGRPTLDLLRAANAEGAAAVLAHPWRRNAISRYEPEWGPLLSAVEIWNRKYDGFAVNRSAANFAQREGVHPFVTLDFHTSRQFFPLAMSVVLSEQPTTSSLVKAMKDGHCQPQFLGMSALRFTGGLEGSTLSVLEALRRGARKPVNRLRQLAG